jgi:hypothetical protein
MTRNHFLTSTGKRQTDMGSTSARRSRRTSLRMLLALPIALLLATALAAPTLAAGTTGSEGLSGYGHKEAKKENEHSKTKKEPEPEPKQPVEPERPPVEPVAKASSLPFTGYDLSWTVGFGVLLVGAGGSIILVQRRQRGLRR